MSKSRKAGAETLNRRFKFDKRSQLFTRPHNQTLSIAATANAPRTHVSPFAVPETPSGFHRRTWSPPVICAASWESWAALHTRPVVAQKNLTITREFFLEMGIAGSPGSLTFALKRN